MTDLKKISPPDDLDWQSWVDRWDRMQQRYLVKRGERFEVIARLIGKTQQRVAKIVDLGCGTGSLMLDVLVAFPNAEVLGIDFDPSMLWLARARLERFGRRAHTELMDLRETSWVSAVPAPVDAVVSATALHWFSPAQLAGVYHQVAQILKPAGIFLNADHVGSDLPEIQREWERHRAEMREQEGRSHSDDWDGFWAAYSRALGLDINEIHQRVIGGWEDGVEEGLPLAWHLDKLREKNFVHVDCFWRCDCDAVYGGIRK
jgi:SAM-dependent methyltransferase